MDILDFLMISNGSYRIYCGISRSSDDLDRDLSCQALHGKSIVKGSQLHLAAGVVFLWG